MQAKNRFTLKKLSEILHILAKTPSKDRVITGFENN